MNCALSLHTAAVQAEQHHHPEAPSDPPCPRALLQFAPACSVPRGDPAQAPPPRSPFQALLPLLRARLSIPVAPESTPGTESAVFFDWGPPTPRSSLSPRSLTGISASPVPPARLPARAPAPAHSTHWGWAAEAPPSASGSSPSSSWCCPPGPEGSQSGHRARSSRPGRISPL